MPRFSIPCGPRRARTAGRSPALILAAVLAAGCSGGSGEPSPPLQSPLGDLSGAVVRWTTTRPARAAVRYGYVSGAYERLAYPAAAGGADKAWRTEHAVPLLRVPAGRPVFVRRVNLERGPVTTAAAEETLVFAAPPVRGPLLRFTSVDVQFGDALVLRCPNGAAVLIDAGDPLEGREGESAPAHLMRWLDDHGVEELAAAALTHVHRDHVGGFVRGGPGGCGVVDRYPVGVFLDLADHSAERDDHRALVARLAELGVPRLTVEPGMTAAANPGRLGWDPGLRVKVLHGGADPRWNDPNNDSLVLRLGYGDVDIMAGGDCELAGEAAVLERFPGDLEGIEVFKAHHHGRYDANGTPLLAAVDPRVALVTVAFAAYRGGVEAGAEATAPALARFAALGTDVFRFDDAAPLGEPADACTFWHATLVTDGVSYEIRVEPSVWGQVSAAPPRQP